MGQVNTDSFISFGIYFVCDSYFLYNFIVIVRYVNIFIHFYNQSSMCPFLTRYETCPWVFFHPRTNPMSTENDSMFCCNLIQLFLNHFQHAEIRMYQVSYEIIWYQYTWFQITKVDKYFYVLIQTEIIIIFEKILCPKNN